MEAVPGSHFKSHVDSSAYASPSHGIGGNHKTDSHRVGGEGFRRDRHPSMAYRALRRRQKVGRFQVVPPMTDPIDSGREQNCRVGLSPTGKRRLSTAPARSRRSDKMVWKRCYRC